MKRYHNIARTRGQTRARRAGRPTNDPFWELIATARRLQAPGGCAWDRAQTLESLFPHLIEEAWEVFEVIRSRRRQRLEEELGDTLYTVLFLALIAERRGWCRLPSMLQATRRKMIRRHPHVFGGAQAGSPREAYLIWQAVKRREPQAPSRGKALRPLLMESWEILRREPDAARRLQRLLGRLRKPSRSSSRPSARPRRGTSRSRGPGPGPRRVD